MFAVGKMTQMSLFNLIFPWVGLTLSWGLRRFYGSVYMFCNPTPFCSSQRPYVEFWYTRCICIVIFASVFGACRFWCCCISYACFRGCQSMRLIAAAERWVSGSAPSIATAERLTLFICSLGFCMPLGWHCFVTLRQLKPLLGLISRC